MPRKQASTTDSVVFNGITFRRYPLSPDESCRKYYRCDGRFRKRGISYLHHEVWKYYNGEIPAGYHIHHKDGNTLNNDISNLELILGREHLSMHTRERAKTEREWFRKNLDAARPKAAEWHRTEEGHKWHVEHGRKVAEEQAKLPKVKRICEQCGKEFYTTSAAAGRARFCSDKCMAKHRRDSGVDNETRRCSICGKEFQCNRYAKQKTCSRECGAKSMVASRRAKARLQSDG